MKVTCLSLPLILLTLGISFTTHASNTTPLCPYTPHDLGYVHHPQTIDSADDFFTGDLDFYDSVTFSEQADFGALSHHYSSCKWNGSTTIYYSKSSLTNQVYLPEHAFVCSYTTSKAENGNDLCVFECDYFIKPPTS